MEETAVKNEQQAADTGQSVVLIAMNRIKRESDRLNRIAKGFPRINWFSIPALTAIIFVVAAGGFAYYLFNPEEFDPMVSAFLVMNVSVYVVLLGLIIWFQFAFMKKEIWRMRDLNKNLKQANELLEENSDDPREFLSGMQEFIKEEKRQETIRPFVFIASLFSEWGNPGIERSNVIYGLFKNEEEERVSLFIDGSRRFLLWIVRIGIIGTFLGLMTAFVFMGNGLPSIFANVDESVKFKEAISLLMRDSLFGYAAAVLSSLGANIASLLYEFLKLRKLQRYNMSYWMDAVYQWYVLSSGKQVSLLQDVKTMIGTVQRVSSAVQNKVVRVNTVLEDANFYRDFPAILTSLSQSMETVNNMASGISKAFEKKNE